jgi:hypothetical protein
VKQERKVRYLVGFIIERRDPFRMSIDASEVGLGADLAEKTIRPTKIA